MSVGRDPQLAPAYGWLAYRWIVVASVATVLAIAMGQLVNGLSVFFIPLELEFGWARGSIALINSAGLIGLALGGIFMGMLADRTSVRAVCLAGALAVGLCVLLAAGADRLWQFYLLFFVAGLLGAGLFAPLIALVAAGFRRVPGWPSASPRPGRRWGRAACPSRPPSSSRSSAGVALSWRSACSRWP